MIYLFYIAFEYITYDIVYFVVIFKINNNFIFIVYVIIYFNS